MTTQEKLRAPFRKEELEIKIQNTDGKSWATLAVYVTARAIQERLDDCFGFDGWNVAYRETSSGVICRLKVIHDGREVIKEDSAELTGKPGEANALKGGCSGSLKRAASSGLGIGRYLYNLPDMWAAEVQATKPANTNGWKNGTYKGTKFWWKPPLLPAQAYTNECDKAPVTPKTNTIVRSRESEEPKAITDPRKYLMKLNTEYPDIVGLCLRHYKKTGIRYLNANEVNSVIKKVEKEASQRAS